MDNVWMAAAFGGNGIAVAALASELLAQEFALQPDPEGHCFDPYRFCDSTRAAHPVSAAK